MAVPSLERAEEVLASYALPEGIVRHSRGVARVAAEAARMVDAAGVPIDVHLVEVAALLHDVDKPETRSSMSHGLVAAQRMVGLGWEELAMPIASHLLAALLDEERYPRGWPSVLVSIADRHVARDFVTIDERVDDMARRHPEFSEEIERSRHLAHALEAELAEVVGLETEDLVEKLRAAWAGGVEA